MRKIAGFAVEADALVPCGVCGAREGKPCKSTQNDKRRKVLLKPGIVHFGRRVKRLLLTARAAPGERERVEAELLKVLRAELR